MFHCPFCHGWEHRDQPLAVLGGVPNTVERALLLRGWTDRVTVIEPAADPDAADHRILAAAGIRTVQATIDRLVSCDRRLDAIVLSTGERLDVHGLLVAAPHAAPNGLAASLGVERTASGHVAVNGLGMTSVPGVWAAGDATSPLASVARAIADGSNCAMSMTRDMRRRDLRSPVADGVAVSVRMVVAWALGIRTETPGRTGVHSTVPTGE